MRITLALAALLGSISLPSAGSAATVERCTPGEAGRVVTAGGETVAVCGTAGLCQGWVGAWATVNGEDLDLCFPPHVDGWSPNLCPALAPYAPGVPGVVDVGEDGDLTVDGYPVSECPPYDS